MTASRTAGVRSSQVQLGPLTDAARRLLDELMGADEALFEAAGMVEVTLLTAVVAGSSFPLLLDMAAVDATVPLEEEERVRGGVEASRPQNCK